MESYHNSLDDTLLKLQALQYSLITNFNALIESDSNIKESVKLAEELKKDLENRLNKQLIEECYEPVFKNQIGSKYVIEVYENKNFKEDKTEKQSTIRLLPVLQFHFRHIPSRAGLTLSQS